MVIYEGPQLIVLNEMGQECQRLYLEELHNTNKMSQDSILYSPFHQSDYSYIIDLMFMGTNYHDYFLLPKDKDKSYKGFGTKKISMNTSYHIYNASLVWGLGGSYISYIQGMYRLLSYHIFQRYS